MNDRPILNKHLESQTFLNYYYLKEELIDFCRENGLPTSGGKIDITKRIAYYLDTGKILKTKSVHKKTIVIDKIELNTKIEDHFVCSEKHRAFFKEHIGNGFSFSVAFQKWLKENTGHTYQEAIDAYYQILDDKKKKMTTIDKQFEYNTYIRDFFADNKGKSLEEAIQCWKYKKQQKGHNRYEKDDLEILVK